MDLFIPTLGRPNRQETWDHLPPSLRERTRLLVDEGELTAYKRYPCVALPSDCRGIGRVRQFVVDNSPGKVVMLDDDLRFAMRREDAPTKFRDATSQEVAKVFEVLESCLETFPHASICTREGGNRDTSAYVTNTRLLRVLAYDTRVLRAEGIRFDRVHVMEDFDVTLQLLRRGHANVSINWAVQDQLGSNKSGGCSIYRSMEIQRDAAIKLHHLHPEFVSVVKKQTKVAWQGQERTDVVIQWKRAYDSYRGVQRDLSD